MKGWRIGGPLIKRDKKREALARKMGPANICERGMTLPSGGAAKCGSSPRKGAGHGRGEDASRPRSLTPVGFRIMLPEVERNAGDPMLFHQAACTTKLTGKDGASLV